MATTSYPLNHPMAVKHWSGDLFKEALKKTYAMRFMGTSSGSLCQVRNETKSEGDRIRIGLRMQLTGAGIQGDGTLEGNEEALSVYHDDVYIDQLRHAVRSSGKMSEQRVPFTVRNEARDGLADWWADRFDDAFFNQLCGNTAVADVRLTGMQAAVAPSNVQLTGTSSASDTVIFGLRHIDYATEIAKEATLPVRPIKAGGDNYCVFMHTYQATDLRAAFAAGDWGDVQKAAITGGETSKNPIFTGALGVYGGSILHESTRIPTGASTSHRRAILCGAQAAAVAFGGSSSVGTKFSWVEELFDYENQLGVAGGSIFGLKKLQFDSNDFGVVTIPTYAVSHA